MPFQIRRASGWVTLCSTLCFSFCWVLHAALSNSIWSIGQAGLASGQAASQVAPQWQQVRYWGSGVGVVFRFLVLCIWNAVFAREGRYARIRWSGLEPQIIGVSCSVYPRCAQDLVQGKEALCNQESFVFLFQFCYAVPLKLQIQWFI